MSIFLNWIELQQKIKEKQKNCDENNFLISTCIFYEKLLNDYTIKMFYDGLSFDDYCEIKNILQHIQEINYIYLCDELKDIERRFKIIYKQLIPMFEYASLSHMVCEETSLVHLVFTNNQFNKIKLYSKDSFMFLCQFHREYTPSMGVTSSKNLFHCFGCGKSGNTIDYIMEYEDMTYEEAVGLLSRIYLIDLDYNVIDENDVLIEKYRSVLLSNDFRKLLDSGHDRFIRNNGFNSLDLVDEKYQKIIKKIERIRNNEHIKYYPNNKPKKLVYNAYNIFEN